MMKKILVFSFLLVLTQFLFAQREICGTVVEDSSGDPLIGVSVVLKGTTNGTVTDIDGKYCLEVPANAKNIELTFSFVGFEYRTIQIEESNILNVKLKGDKVSLDEVVVGYRVPSTSNRKTKTTPAKGRTEVLMSIDLDSKRPSSVPPPPPPWHRLSRAHCFCC